MRHLCRGNATPLLDLCHKFNAETRDGQRMGTYSKLLGDAISSLIKVKETTDLFLVPRRRQRLAIRQTKSAVSITLNQFVS